MLHIIATLRSLFIHEAKIECKSNIDATPLYAACHEGHLLVVDLLINKGADIEDSRFFVSLLSFL